MNTMKINKYIGALFLLTITVLVGCTKDPDFPPVKVLPEGNIISIDSVRNIYTAFDTTIVDDISIYGIITADESSANLYKELYIQDETNAIKLGLTSSSKFYIGDKVRVALKGATITRASSMLLIDGLDPAVNIIKQQSGLNLTPEVVTINDLAIVGVYSPYQGKLVQINNVEFSCSEMCKPWANPITQYDENRTLTDTAGNTIVVRSSGYATFAAQTLPTGQGSIIAVVSQYTGTVQLTIRTPDELTMYGSRKNVCDPFLQNFESEMVTTCEWSQQNVVGNVDWAASDLGSSDFYGIIKNLKNSVFQACETWYISPSVNLSAMANPTFSMQSDVNYNGPTLEVFITSNYTGDATTTTWTALPVPLDANNTGWGFFSSGNVSLLPYAAPNARIAFKYTGSNVDGATWEIDDLKIVDL
jgi:hypothetical protein